MSQRSLELLKQKWWRSYLNRGRLPHAIHKDSAGLRWHHASSSRCSRLAEALLFPSQVTFLAPSPGPLPGKFLLAGSLKLFLE